MDRSSKGNEGRVLTEARIAEVDGKIPSPSERASLVWSILQGHAPELTNWDLICFSVEFMGMSVQAFPWLEEVAKKASRLVYMAHYINSEQIDRESVIKRAVGDNPAQSDKARLEQTKVIEGNSIRPFLPSYDSGRGS